VVVLFWFCILAVVDCEMVVVSEGGCGCKY